MAASPNWPATVRATVAQVSVANPNRTGSGTIVTVFVAGSGGSRIDSIVVHAVATTTAGMVRLFLHDGSASHLWREVPIPVDTASATDPAWSTEIALAEPLFLPSGWSLRASTQNAETFNVFAFGGDY